LLGTSKDSDMPNRFNIEMYGLSKQDFFDPYTYHKYRFVLFPKDNSVTQSIIKGFQYEHYIFKFLVENDIRLTGKDMVEVGSNNGNFTIDFATLVGDTGRVHAFEPQRIIYYQLCGNVFLNGFANVWCYNVSLGDMDSEVKIEKPNYFSDKHVNFGDVAIHSGVGTEYENVQVRKLDNYDFGDLALIKADVQGYELFVLRGAEKTIMKHRPYIFIEIEDDKLAYHGLSKSDIEATLDSLGYTLKHFQEGYLYNSTTGYCLDYVAIPNEKNPDKYFIP